MRFTPIEMMVEAIMAYLSILFVRFCEEEAWIKKADGPKAFNSLCEIRVKVHLPLAITYDAAFNSLCEIHG